MIVRVLLAGLWQGGAIVAIAYLVCWGVPLRNATTRYAVWFTALLALVAIPVLTTSHVGGFLSAAFQPRGPSGTWTVSLLPTRSLGIIAPGFLTFGAPWIAGAWSAGVGVCLLRLGASLARVGRIRKNAAEFPAFDNVFISEDVAIPVVVGFRKPAIVVPKSLSERSGRKIWRVSSRTSARPTSGCRLQQPQRPRTVHRWPRPGLGAWDESQGIGHGAGCDRAQR